MASQALSDLSRAILSNDIEFAKQILLAIPISDLPEKTVNNFLRRFLSEAASADRIEIGREILNLYSRIFPSGQKISRTTSILLLPSFSLPTLSFLMKIDNVLLDEVVFELISWDSSPEVRNACVKLPSIFGPQPYELWKRYLEIARRERNESCTDVFFSFVSSTSPSIEKPTWILKKPDNFVSPEEDFEISFPPVNEELISSLLSSFSTNYGINLNFEDNPRQVVESSIESLSIPEKILLFRPILENFFTSESYFRSYGPINPVSFDDICPMLTCDIFSIDIETDEVIDVFEGICDFCAIKIPNRRWSLRMPRPFESWKDWYCSFECLRNAVPSISSDSPNDFTYALIDDIEKRIFSIGIYESV
jgi:hypothetical protein